MLHTNGSTLNNAEFIDLLLGDNSDGSKSVGSKPLSPIFLFGVLTVGSFRAIGAMSVFLNAVSDGSNYLVSFFINLLISCHQLLATNGKLDSIFTILINSEMLRNKLARKQPHSIDILLDCVVILI